MNEIQDRELRLFLDAIRESSIYDFSNYSISSLKRRVNKVLMDYKLPFNQILENIKNDFLFLENIVKNITVNTTEFFRDPKIWIFLKEEVLSNYKSVDVIRIWHVGASTGQEVYSMMILLNEMNLLGKSEIYVTDLNTDVLETSKKGVYKYSFNKEHISNFDSVLNVISENGSVNYSRYFEIDRISDIMRMKEFLISKPIYKKMDLVKDDNIFGLSFDLIICRNVIIYFNYELQNKVFNLFYRSLNEKGYLLLGMHESIIGPYTAGFEKKGQVYQKK